MKKANTIGAAAVFSAFTFISHLPAKATVIIQDDFNSPQLTAIAGRTPAIVNVPGSSWVKATNATSGFTVSVDNTVGNPLPGAYLSSQTAAAINLDLNSVASIITLSAHIKLFSLAGPASAGRGVALGFYGNSWLGTGQYSQNGFTGLVLDGTGNINLVQDLNQNGFFSTGSVFETPVAYAGDSFNKFGFYDLTYSVDTSSGKITSVSLTGSTADYSSLMNRSLFTVANTSHAGYYSSSTSGSSAGYLDNFTVSATAVPEPSAYALSALSALGLCMSRRRRHSSL